MSRSIGEPLSLCAFEGAIGTLQIADTEGDPVVVPKIELGGVPVQMRLVDMDVAAVDAALEPGITRFSFRIGRYAEAGGY